MLRQLNEIGIVTADNLAQFRERAMQARLHCAARNIQRRGDFGLRQFQEIAQRDQGSLIRFKLAHRGHQALLLFTFDGESLNGQVVVFHDDLPGVSFVHAISALRCLNPIERRIGDNAQQPGTKGPALLERAQRAIGAQKGILRGVGGIVLFMSNEVRHAEGNLFVPLHQLLVSGHVAVLCVRNQALFLDQAYPPDGRIS
jgi:hypothetical protein